MGHFSSSVTVVTAISGGQAHAMTATAVSSVSLEPPLILVCVGHASRFHDAVLAAGSWAVSILDRGPGAAGPALLPARALRWRRSSTASRMFRRRYPGLRC